MSLIQSFLGSELLSYTAVMIVLFTDFGWEGPYLGQMQARIHALTPQAPVINLFADLPAHNPKAAAYLLPAYTVVFPVGTVFVCVVDPAVGTDTHKPAALRCDDRWYVGPDNGLFEILRRRARAVDNHVILWQPETLSVSFHGRDLYAPVAARLLAGETVEMQPDAGLRFPDWPDDLAEVVYIDRFGNAMTGLRAAGVPASTRLSVNGVDVKHAPTFAAVATGQTFWYANANGLLEIAANQGRADCALGARVGSSVLLLNDDPPAPAGAGA